MPLALLLIDYYEKRKLDKKKVFEKVPFFVLSVIIIILTLVLKEHASVIQDLTPIFSIFDRVFLVIQLFIIY